MSTEPAKPLTAQEVNERSLSNTRRIESLQERIDKEGDFVARYKLTEWLDQAQSEARLLATIAERERQIARLKTGLERVAADSEDSISAEWAQQILDEVFQGEAEPISLSRAEKALKAAQTAGFVCFVGTCSGRRYFSKKYPDGGDVTWSCGFGDKFSQSFAAKEIQEALNDGETFPELGDWE